MSEKSYLGLTLASTVVLLAACGTNVSVEDVNESASQAKSSFDELVAQNHKLNELELEMNAHFETVLAEDDELATIQDESASIFENMNERQTTIDNMDEHLELINTQAETLGQYEGTDLPEETVKQISENFLAFTEEIENYQSRYEESLTKQQDYLASIAAEESNYEDFSNGIGEVNSDYSDLQETTLTLDQRFAEINDQLSSLNEMTDSSTNEAETNEDDTAEEEVDEDNTTEEDTEENSEESAEDVEEIEEESIAPETALLLVNSEQLLSIPNQFPSKFVYDSGIDIKYPEDGVKGVYVTAYSAGGDKMDYLTNLINTTDLNAMVIDIKDDEGYITLDLESENELVQKMSSNFIDDTDQLMTHLDENDIYPIARIVVFKDTLLAKEKPELSFTHGDGSVWSNGNGDSFVNPYLKEVWDYNIEVAIQAAKLGFKEIQFDYVRFPEGFELLDRDLNYGHGHYGDDDADVINMEYRNQAVTDFVAYAREQLQPYGVDVSVDIFGYAAVVRETPGIGQSFPGIASEVDVISSMIYPSHWGLGNLDVAIPDLEPYNVVDNYSKIELAILDELGDDAPVTRPWIQDFTASYLGAGYYMEYGDHEVTEQIRALADNGIHEYLLWNAGNTYSEGATFSFE